MKFHTFPVRACAAFFLIVSIIACKPAKPVQASPLALPNADIQPLVVFVQGTPTLSRAGALFPLEEGQSLLEGDLVSTDAVSSVEITWGAFATVRVLPSTRLAIALVPAESRRSELSLVSGAVLAKVQKLAGSDEFLVGSPNSSAGVRGTAFLVSYDAQGLTRIAVREGRVALLPKGNLVSGLLDGRYANSAAGAAVDAAFSASPAAGAGEELLLDGKETAKIDAAEIAVGKLMVAAENARSAGTDLDEVADPSALLAPAGSEAASALASSFAAWKPVALSPGNRELLELLDHLRDPGASAAKLPAALPLERFSSAVRPVVKAPVAPSFPSVDWSLDLSRSGLRDSLTRTGTSLVALDSEGTVHAVSTDGKALWRSAEAGVAIFALDKSVALVGKGELVLLDAAQGKKTGSWKFDGFAGTPVARPVPVPQGLALATPRGVAIVRAENATLVKEILIPGGLSAPLVLADRELVGLSGSGALVIIDPAKGTIIQQFPEALTIPAYAPRYRAGVAYAVDRSGRVVALNVASRTLLWTSELGTQVASEMEVGPELLWLWTADHRLLALSVSDGKSRGPALKGVESAPLLANGRLYYGTSTGSLAVVDASSGAKIREIALPGAQAVRPILIAGELYAGTKAGKVLKVDLAQVK